MTEYVVIIRDGEAAKACYRIEASDTQLSMLKEMVKAGVYVFEGNHLTVTLIQLLILTLKCYIDFKFKLLKRCLKNRSN